MVKETKEVLEVTTVPELAFYVFNTKLGLDLVGKDSSMLKGVEVVSLKVNKESNGNPVNVTSVEHKWTTKDTNDFMEFNLRKENILALKNIQVAFKTAVVIFENTLQYMYKFSSVLSVNFKETTKGITHSSAIPFSNKEITITDDYHMLLEPFVINSDSDVRITISNMSLTLRTENYVLELNYPANFIDNLATCEPRYSNY